LRRSPSQSAELAWSYPQSRSTLQVRGLGRWDSARIPCAGEPCVALARVLEAMKPQGQPTKMWVCLPSWRASALPAAISRGRATFAIHHFGGDRS
jgi:hypothetical protein